MTNADRQPNGEYLTLTAEHADGWHERDHHPQCPECRRELKARTKAAWDAAAAKLAGK